MTERERKPDIPKMVATVGVRIPVLTVRLGVSYLRLKRKARKASDEFARQLEHEGVPHALARELGDAYGSELSLRKFFDMTGGGFFRGLS